MEIFGYFSRCLVICNVSVRFCNPVFWSPRAAVAERGFISVTNSVFPSPLPAERVGRTGDRVSGRFSTARLDLRTRKLQYPKTAGFYMLRRAVCRSICIIAEHKGMRSGLVPILARFRLAPGACLLQNMSPPRSHG